MLSSSHFDTMLPYAGGGGGGQRVGVGVPLDHHHHRRPSSYRQNVEVAPSCPRCDSPNTKFCYYNNYSLSQPRYFCKGCRRYWTKGGSLRNVPVGGGCRKTNRRGSKAAARSSQLAAFSHRFPGAVRPDMLLEGMVGNNPGGGVGEQPPAVSSSADKAPDGSEIDLALLYTKFLNRQPQVEVERCAVVPEPVDASSGVTGNGAVAPPDQLPFSSQQQQDRVGHLQSGPAATKALGELGCFSMDQSCYDSLGLPTDEGDFILPPSTWHQAAKYEPFDSLPKDDAMSIAEDVWTNVLACQGLEAALCRPS